MKLKQRTPSTVGNLDNRNNHLVSTFLFAREPRLIIRARLHREGRGDDNTIVFFCTGALVKFIYNFWRNNAFKKDLFPVQAGKCR